MNTVIDRLVPDCDALRRAPRLCLFAHYHPTDTVADYVLLYLRDLKAAGFATLVISTSDLPDAEQAKLVGTCDGLILRDNYGLDVAGWAEACILLFPIRAELLLLCNDSVYGPLWPVGTFIDELTAHAADFYGAVATHDLGEHLQSWFRLFRPSAYNSAPFAELMLRPVPREGNKWDVIMAYEIGVTRRLIDAGLTYHAAYAADHPAALARRAPINPTQVLWRRLVERHRVPFLKVDLLRDNLFGGRSVASWPTLVAPERRELVGLIRDDLAARKAHWARGWMLRYYDRRGKNYAPELRPLFALDDRLGGRAGGAILPVFLGVMYAGRAARGLARQVRRRLRPRPDDRVGE